MKNLRLVLTLVLILVSIAIVQAQEYGLPKAWPGLLRIICQIFFGTAECPASGEIIQGLAVFAMVAFVMYDIVWIATPLDEKVCYVVGFASAALAANAQINAKIIDFFTKIAGAGAPSVVIIVVIAALFIFFGYWFAGWFARPLKRAAKIRRAKELGMRKAIPLITYREMAEAATR